MIRLFFIFSALLLVACTPSPSPNFTLKNTYWNLISLHSKTSTNAPNQPEVHIVFHLNDNILHGNDGCNNLRAKFQAQDGIIKIQNIISSKIACAEGISQAYSFLKALELSDAYKIKETELILYHNDIEISRFEAKEDY